MRKVRNSKRESGRERETPARNYTTESITRLSLLQEIDRISSRRNKENFGEEKEG